MTRKNIAWFIASVILLFVLSIYLGYWVGRAL